MTQRVIVISDLHIAAPGLLNNFHAGTALAKFCAMIARPNTTLVLAGDIFDFLQVEDRSAVFDNAIMPALICGTLDAVASESWGQAFFAALGDLIRRGGRCVVLPGNHDPELVHPIFKEQLCARIGLPVGLTSLDIHTRGPWYTRLGEREVVVGHGHRIDSWNNIDPAMMDAVLNGEPLQLPPGSRLVTQVLNAFKNACDATGLPRFPFVDLLKPEVPAVPLLLLYLDRKLAMQHLPAALGLSIESIANAVGRRFMAASRSLQPTLLSLLRQRTISPLRSL